MGMFFLWIFFSVTYTFHETSILPEMISSHQSQFKAELSTWLIHNLATLKVQSKTWRLRKTLPCLMPLPPYRKSALVFSLLIMKEGKSTASLAIKFEMFEKSLKNLNDTKRHLATLSNWRKWLMAFANHFTFAINGEIDYKSSNCALRCKFIVRRALAAFKIQ